MPKRVSDMKYRRFKAKYEGKVLKPEEPLDLPEGAEVNLLIVPSFSSVRGILRGAGKDSVTLQHQALRGG